MKVVKTKICIIGAGPGGMLASIYLAKHGISCILLDKETFPRDKVCGDALSGRVCEIMREVDPSLYYKFLTQNFINGIYGATFVAPNLTSLRIPEADNKITTEEPLGYIAKRVDFDNFLINQVKKYKSINLYEKKEIVSYKRTQTGWVLNAKNESLTIEAELLIVADGANSYFARHVAGIDKKMSINFIGVRKYFSGVSKTKSDNVIELLFLKEFLPGYFWIMPLRNDIFNVGIMMRSDFPKKDVLNLRKSIDETINKYPSLLSRFKNAKTIDDAKGYRLPIVSKRIKISGNRYIIIGDAANLIDPFTGEGIANSMLSGVLAAKYAILAIQKADYSDRFLKNYDKEVYETLGNRFGIGRILQFLSIFPWIFNKVITRASRSRLFTETLSFVFVDPKMKKRLFNPIFYFKVFLLKQ